MIRRRLWLLVLLCACAPKANVMVSVDYHPKAVRRVAFAGFQDFPGVPGSGERAAEAFEKHLGDAGYSVLDHYQFAAMLGVAAAPRNFDSQTLQKLKASGIDAVAFGKLTAYTDTHDVTVMVNEVQQQEVQPIVGQEVTIERREGERKFTKRDFVAGYQESVVYAPTPELQLVIAQVGLSVRAIDTTSGGLLWSASIMSSGDPGWKPDASQYTVNDATEQASTALMKDLFSKMKKTAKMDKE